MPIRQICSPNSSGLAFETTNDVMGNIATVTRTFKRGESVMRSVAFSWKLSYKFLLTKCSCCFHEVVAVNSRCSQCQSVFYCSVKCQRRDWRSHKHECKNIGIIKSLHLHPVDEEKLCLLLRAVHASLSCAKECSTQATCNGAAIACGSNHLSGLSVHHRLLTSDEQSIADCVSNLCNTPIEGVERLLLAFESNNFGILNELLECVASAVFPC